MAKQLSDGREFEVTGEIVAFNKETRRGELRLESGTLVAFRLGADFDLQRVYDHFGRPGTPFVGAFRLAA